MGGMTLPLCLSHKGTTLQKGLLGPDPTCHQVLLDQELVGYWWNQTGLVTETGTCLCCMSILENLGWA